MAGPGQALASSSQLVSFFCQVRCRFGEAPAAALPNYRPVRRTLSEAHAQGGGGSGPSSARSARGTSPEAVQAALNRSLANLLRQSSKPVGDAGSSGGSGVGSAPGSGPGSPPDHPQQRQPVGSLLAQQQEPQLGSPGPQQQQQLGGPPVQQPLAAGLQQPAAGSPGSQQHEGTSRQMRQQGSFKQNAGEWPAGVGS